jgi:4-amino-4-deoxy-L-arabinose transferase-like glycosyltransferase
MIESSWRTGSAHLWARPTCVLSVIFGYLAVHFAVRMAMWPTLGIDDAEQALLAQSFSWNYRNSAPPLFTWLVLGLGKAIGVNIVSISLVRYTLLAIVFVFAYLTARRLIGDARLAALSVYSFAAIYVFAFYSHHDLTHTTAMAAMLGLGWYVFVRLAESRAVVWYVALGAVFGLGLIGKWNFVMFAAAVPLACLVRPETRPLVLTWKIIPAGLVCGLIVLPAVASILLAGSSGGGTAQSVLAGEQAPYLARVAEGTGRLAMAAIVYPQPLLPLFLLFFARPLWTGLRDTSARRPSGQPALDASFIGWTIAISLCLHLLLVIAVGAREFSERLMQPPLFILPVLLFMLVERGRPATWAVNAFAVALAVLAGGTLAARAGVYFRGADYCGSCRDMMPVQRLAAELRAAGFSGSGTVLAEGFHIAGNMRAAFPNARIFDVNYPSALWPGEPDAGQCLMLWQERPDGGGSDAAPGSLTAFLTDRLQSATDLPHREGVASALMFGSSTREYRLGYRLYEGPAGDCR